MMRIVRAVAALGMWTLVAAVACAQGITSAGRPAGMAKEADPDWEVVTVKAADPNYPYDYISTKGRHVVVKNQTALAVLRLAYGVQRNQIVNAPEWLKTEKWDVDGVPETAGTPDRRQMQVLLRKLFAERFGMKAHIEQQEMPVYALTVAKSGAKMESSKADPDVQPEDQGGSTSGRQVRQYTNVSAGDLAGMLQFHLDRPVVDQTGLKGRYDFKMQWTVEDAPPSADPNAPPGLFTAIQEQIGLKLEPAKAMAEVLVIDTVERPGAN